ncbi:MAG: C-terminal helicase domain-containing protein, partial [candidate division WOR-3 bacterium]
RSFQEGAVPVAIFTLKTGGVGLNLERASHVIHFDLWWNPATESQATDRAHRIGQTRRVMVHRLMTRGTLEEKINELLLRKKGLAEDILAHGETYFTELSDDELRDILGLSA